MGRHCQLASSLAGSPASTHAVAPVFQPTGRHFSPAHWRALSCLRTRIASAPRGLWSRLRPLGRHVLPYWRTHHHASQDRSPVCQFTGSLACRRALLFALHAQHAFSFCVGQAPLSASQAPSFREGSLLASQCFGPESPLGLSPISSLLLCTCLLYVVCTSPAPGSLPPVRGPCKFAAPSIWASSLQADVS